ncbi:FAD dependent oxidoreductase [Dactylonectria macrodidyma]|uniref:sarcosine oxidasee (formaldehyde-forming) n=1 Tax=Dactylonectria macrodidyma TaxID=307937 RepID=A0A9P9E7E8_9HYPO|nr:FAD dependent oxidoreductase [Dactylonectria macrodidyma]
MERYDIAVVGLGALGSGAAYHAAIKGAKVIGFEQFELGHVRGASHDTSRIVRTSYENSEFVALARSAYKDWAELERRSGLTLLNITGGVVLIPKEGPTLASNFMKSLEANGVPYELLNTKQVNERWPGFRVPDGVECVYTADTGIAHAAKSVTTMQYQARANGAVLREKTRVDLLTPTDDGVIIQTSNGQVRAGKVILAADAWANKLLKPLGAEIPQLTVMQEQITYFKPSNPDKFDPERFPVWIWAGETWYYGFPTYGEPTIKAGQDAQQNIMPPDQRTFQHSPELQRKLTNFMDTIIPDHGEALRTVTCQYALTPDRQFMIGPLKKHPNIIVAMGNGHAFKFAPAIGRVTAELAIDGKTSDDISKFPIQQAPESRL